MAFQSGCMLCGQELVYLEGNETLTCVYCGESFSANARCAQGHYVCDTCHSLNANDLIEQFCVQTELLDPVEMAITLMRHPSIKMHGPEHHFLVPAVLLAAAANRTGRADDKTVLVRKARKRAEDVKGGFCGFCGACGAGIGTGIFASVFTGATPLSKLEWSLSNHMTSASLSVIADHGGPRCCKRNTFLALITAGQFAREQFGLDLPVSEAITCEFYPMNRECLKQDCPFHPKQ